MLKVTQNDLLKFLNEENLSPYIEKENQLVYILINSKTENIPLFFVIRNDGEILQLISYLPYQLKDSLLNETSRLLHILNKDLDMPGFGLDETQNLMFFRCVIPCINCEIKKQLLKVYIETIKIACESFSHAIGLVSSGQLSIDELKKQKID